MVKKETLLDIELKDHFKFTLNGVLPKKGSFALKSFPILEKATSQQSVLLEILEKSLGKIIFKAEALDRSESNITLKYNSIDENGFYLPLLFEQQSYQVQLTSFSTDKYTFVHDHVSIMSNIGVFSEHKTVSGTFNFYNNVGETVFWICKNNTPYIAISLLVCSSKIEYWSSRIAMLTEIQSVHNHLLQAFFRPTKESAISSKGKASGLEWLTNFAYYMDVLIKDMLAIERKSHSSLITTLEQLRVDKIRKPDNVYLSRVNRLGKKTANASGKIWHSKKLNNWNTPENRYIKFLLTRISKRGKKWTTHCQNLINDYYKTDSAAQNHLDSISAQIEIISNSLMNPFWSSIKDTKEKLADKGNFIFHKEFVRTENTANAISKAISFHVSGSKFFYGLSIDQLYEFWSFFKLAKLCSNLLYGSENALILRLKTDHFNTIINRGKSSEIILKGNIALSLNPLYTKTSNTYFSPLVNQKPDIVFQLLSERVLVLFDAKYKFIVCISNPDGKIELLDNSDLISKNIEGLEYTIFPQETDINTMHRYKDAIHVRENVNPSSKAAKIGLILYPDKPKSEKQLFSMFETIKSFGIGALPLSPGVTDNEWVAEVVKGNLIPANAFESEQVRFVAKILSQVFQPLGGNEGQEYKLPEVQISMAAENEAHWTSKDGIM